MQYTSRKWDMIIGRRKKQFSISRLSTVLKIDSCLLLTQGYLNLHTKRHPNNIASSALWSYWNHMVYKHVLTLKNYPNQGHWTGSRKQLSRSLVACLIHHKSGPTETPFTTTCKCLHLFASVWCKISILTWLFYIVKVLLDPFSAIVS